MRTAHSVDLRDKIAQQHVEPNMGERRFLIQCPVHRGEAGHSILKLSQRRNRFGAGHLSHLHVDDRRDELKIVLHPMVHFFQQHLTFEDRVLQIGFVTQQLVGHAFEGFVDRQNLAGRIVNLFRGLDIAIGREPAHPATQIADVPQHKTVQRHHRDNDPDKPHKKREEQR